MSKSGIGWTDFSINPYGWHCNPVSEGCENCYAMTLAERYGKDFKTPPEWKGDDWWFRKVSKVPDGQRVFVNSFSDTFHHRAQPEWIRTIFSAIVQRPGVIFQVLTKRIERAVAMAGELPWPENLWIGTSVESAKYVGRIADLKRVPTPNRFISFEPILGSIGRVDLSGIGWVITGGESGPNRRYFDKRWASDIRQQCEAQGVAFYHKQGSAFKPGEDRVLDGALWDGYPAAFEAASKTTPTPEQLTLF